MLLSRSRSYTLTNDEIELIQDLEIWRGKNLEGLLQSFDFFFALLDALGIGHACVDASWLEFLKFLQSFIEQIHCGLHALSLNLEFGMFGRQVGLSSSSSCKALSSKSTA